ncbi:MAG: LD-carboxypeptidase [Herpetosiphon sp.]
MLKPPMLEAGMTIGIVAPCSQMPERSTTRRGVMELERLGFRVVFGEHAGDQYGYLAGQDEDRAEDLLAMLEREDVDAVMCLRGGYGALRTVRALDLARLRRLAGKAAKVFIGFSDVTVLHAVLQRELGWTTFYGPMVLTLAHATPYTLEALRRGVMATEPFDVLPDPDDLYVETMVAGMVEAPLVGGCLALVTALLGTPWEIDLRGKIFFWEDVHAAPYQIDRMLSQLLAAGKIQECAGFVIGEHADCGAHSPGSTLGLEQVFDDLIRPLGLPTLYHLPIGHGQHLATLPIGCRAVLDAGEKTLKILEPGVAQRDRG